MLVILEV